MAELELTWEQAEDTQARVTCCGGSGLAVSLSQTDCYRSEAVVCWLCWASEVDSQAACLQMGSHRDRSKAMELWAQRAQRAQRL